MSRRPYRTPVDLFSFQDIMTSVTAVVILITLLLCVELINRHVGGSEGPAAQEVDAVQRQLAAVESEISRLTDQVRSHAQLQKHVAGRTAEEIATECKQLEKDVRTLEAELLLAEAQLQDAYKEQNTVNESIKKAQRQLQDKQKDIEEALRKRQRIATGQDLIFNPVSPSGKRTWLLVLSDQNWTLRPLDQNRPPIVLNKARDRISELEKLIRMRDQRQDHFMIFLRPSAASQFHIVAKLLRDQGFDLGFDLIGENQTILLPNGASEP